MIFHITSRAAWKEANPLGEYRGDTLESEGFIHTSQRDQLVRVANQRFQERFDLVLLVIDPSKLTSPLKYEDGGEGEMFPHIYGPLNMAAVTNVLPFPPNDEGNFDLPKELRQLA